MFEPDNLRELVEHYSIEAFGGDIDKFLDTVEFDSAQPSFDCVCSIGESASNSEVYIIDRETGKYVNWYKLTHIGRSATTNVDSEDELRDFFIKFKKVSENPINE